MLFLSLFPTRTILKRKPRVCKRFYGIAQYIRGNGVVLQEGVRVGAVQQRAELLPSCLSKGVAELLGQFLWRIHHGELILQGTAPQLHLQLKLRICIFTVREDRDISNNITNIKM